LNLISASTRPGPCAHALLKRVDPDFSEDHYSKGTNPQIRRSPHQAGGDTVFHSRTVERARGSCVDEYAVPGWKGRLVGRKDDIVLESGRFDRRYRIEFPEVD